MVCVLLLVVLFSFAGDLWSLLGGSLWLFAGDLCSLSGGLQSFAAGLWSFVLVYGGTCPSNYVCKSVHVN